MTIWHATPAELSAYRHGSDDSVLAASVEAHLLACSRCREVLAGTGDGAVRTPRDAGRT